MNINDATNFNDNDEIKHQMSEALKSHLPHLKENAFEQFITSHPQSHKLSKCTIIVVFPHSVNVAKLSRFIDDFFLERSRGCNNG